MDNDPRNYYVRDDLVYDRTSNGYERWTCTHCERSLVRQPYMNDRGWNIHFDLFKERHRTCPIVLK